ncbi:rCG39270 [Rattus norvegicus]|uniref:RCG39270 n=1 Tax=Rattus norvegicus TaxID=10116 RepID=A6I7B9_RAT|nr:rCG39270 [Rattus norvegicus]
MNNPKVKAHGKKVLLRVWTTSRRSLLI